jgi:hypothetical protein
MCKQKDFNIEIKKEIFKSAISWQNKIIFNIETYNTYKNTV